MKARISVKAILKWVLAVALALLIPVTNYLVDPAGLFTTDISGTVEEQAVNIILSGKNAEGLINYDERLVKRLCIYGLEDVDVLALGSSRVALIDREMAASDSFFNLSVTSAAMRDIVAMYGIAHMNGLTPERVIIALDPWYINSNYSSERFEQVLTDGYVYALTQLMGYNVDDVGYSASVNNKYLGADNKGSFFDLPLNTQLELFSIPYFQSSLSLLFKADDDGITTITATSSAISTNAVLRADGSYSYPEDYRNNSIATITELASSLTIQVAENKARIFGCEDVYADDPYRYIFYDFVECLVLSGVQVDLVIPPVNPILWDFMLQHDRYAPILAADDFFISMANDLGCRVVGSFDPYEVGAGVEDFYDGYHYKPEKLSQLMDKLAEVN